MKLRLLLLISTFSATLGLAATTFENSWAATQAANRALRAKDYPQALEAAQQAISLASGKNAQARALALFGRVGIAAEDWGELINTLEPHINTYANFAQAPPPLRQAFAALATASLKSQSYDTFKKQIDHLAKEEVTAGSFEFWRATAMVLAQAALDQKNDPAGSSPTEAELVGQEGGGSTFGIWTRPLEVDGRIVHDATRLAEAEALLMEKMPQDKLSNSLRLTRDCALLEVHSLAGDESSRWQARRRLLEHILSFKPASEDEVKDLFGACEELLKYHEQRYEWNTGADVIDELIGKCPRIASDYKAVLLGYSLGYLMRAGEEDRYTGILAKLEKESVNSAYFQGYIEALRILKGDRQLYLQTHELVPAILAKQDAMAPLEEYKLFGSLLDLAIRDRDIPLARHSMATLRRLDREYTEAVRLDREQAQSSRAAGREHTSQLPPATSLGWTILSRYAQFLYQEHLFSEIVDHMEFFAGKFREDSDAVLKLAIAHINTGQPKKASAILSALATNTSVKDGHRFAGAVLNSLATSQDIDHFKKDIRATYQNAKEQSFNSSDTLEAAEQLYMWVLQTTRYVFLTERVDYIKAMQDFQESLKHPEPRISRSIGYFPNPPGSADTWLRSGLINDASLVENRFGEYRMFSSNRRETELARLREGAEPRLAKFDEGKEGGVIVVYDEYGLHIYMQFNDPESGAIRAGLKRPASIELTILPGEDQPYHQTFYTTMNPSDYVKIEWDTASPRYRYTRDYIKNSVAQSTNATAAYTFMPWLLFHDKLPSHGDTWRMVLVARWAGKLRSLGGSAVHELGRGLALEFDLPPQRKTQIRRNVVRTAAAHYLGTRQLWENADFWNDPYLGDPAFYESALTPLLEKLDAVAQSIASADPMTSDPDLYEGYFKDYVALWADWRMHLYRLRGEYIEDSLFSPEKTKGGK